MAVKKRKKVFKYRKLRSKIILEFGTQANFADYLDVSAQTISKLLNGDTAFTQETIVKWCDILGIDLMQVGKYFFC